MLDIELVSEFSSWTMDIIFHGNNKEMYHSDQINNGTDDWYLKHVNNGC